MSEIVGAFGTSHTAMMIRLFDRADVAQAGRVRAAFDEVRRRLAALDPDAIVVVGSEHFKTFFLNNFPTFCLGVAERYEGWGDAGVPNYSMRGHPRLSRGLLTSLIDDGFDLSFSEEMRLDHGFVTPLHFVRPEMDIPIVPLFQNCTVPPLPTLRRCFQLGQALRHAIANSDAGRVVVIGSGGLSHWVGVPEMGRINRSFDMHVLDLLRTGQVDAVAGLSTEEVERAGGNGGQELRNWVTMLGAAGAATVEVLAYEPVDAWVTGIALIHCSPAMREPTRAAA